MMQRMVGLDETIVWNECRRDAEQGPTLFTSVPSVSCDLQLDPHAPFPKEFLGNPREPKLLFMILRETEAGIVCLSVTCRCKSGFAASDRGRHKIYVKSTRNRCARE